MDTHDGEMDASELEAKLTVYATEYLRGYHESVNGPYGEARAQVAGLGNNQYFRLADREIGRNVAVAALVADYDFYVFFVNAPDTLIKGWKSSLGGDQFTQAWSERTPADRARKQVLDFLELSEREVIHEVHAPGTPFLRFDFDYISSQAYLHGLHAGKRDGRSAELALPDITAEAKRISGQRDFTGRYQRLGELKKPQIRGIRFEELWRDVLEFYGWRPKKIRIPGEENDFTALYQGLHVLGEVRWYEAPMPGGKMREFLAKLDPRPQTIGMFVSYSGIDEGARSVIRRSVNSKTVVVFEKPDIDAVLL